MTTIRRTITSLAALSFGALLTTCSSELAPTGSIALTLAKGPAWPDALAVAEVATAVVSVTAPGQHAVTGVTLTWGSTDSSIITVTPASVPTGATESERLAAALRGLLTSHRPGSATIVVRVAQAGFDPVELRAPVVVNDRGADSLLSVGDVDTIGLTLQRADASFLSGATVSWSSSDPSVLGVVALGTDPTRAILTARTGGSAEVNATIQNTSGHADFQLPVAVRPLQIVESPTWATTLNLNNTATFGVQVLDALGQVRANAKVQWASTNQTAFSVDSTGAVLARSRGGGELVASVGAAPFQVVEHRATLQVLQKWKAVSAGDFHTCAITALDGTGYCWGYNAEGQLGLGFDFNTLALSTLPRLVATSHKFSELLAGESHTCGREGSQNLLCWGARDRAQLGDGQCAPGGMGTTCFSSAESPVMIVSGGMLGTEQVHLDQLVVGGNFTCIVIVNGASGSFSSRKARCWGTSDENGRGINFASQASAAVELTPGPDAQAKITDIAAGGEHLCVSTDEVSWSQCEGVDDQGQLGDGVLGNPPGPTWSPKGLVVIGGDLANPGGDGRPTGEFTGGRSHTCAVDAVGVLCWGSNFSGQLGSAVAGQALFPTRATIAVPVTQLTAGSSHTCALASNGDAWCWGSNSRGQLGQGTIGGSNAVPTIVSGGFKFTAISAGGDHTCAVTTDGSLYCWGANDAGQLGDGTATNRATPVRVAEGQQ
jgi:alpha-tubulin suppressor-like RCC1 family protein